jgi:hypothetical protein
MREAARERVLARINNRKPTSHKKFCGTTGAIVDCSPHECYRLENTCYKELRALVQKHRPLLEALRDHVIQKSNLSSIHAREVATREYGDLVGLLIGFVDPPGKGTTNA